MKRPTKPGITLLAIVIAAAIAAPVLSPNDPDLSKLVRRGLIVLKPEVRLMNESFRLFVLVQSRTDEDVVRTEGEARSSSSWQYLKVALSVAVVVVMVFLFATQRDLYNSTIVAVTSIAAGLPAVFNFFNLFHKNTAAVRLSVFQNQVFAPTHHPPQRFSNSVPCIAVPARSGFFVYTAIPARQIVSPHLIERRPYRRIWTV